MKLSSVPFLLREAFLNLRRNGLMTFAAISAITIALSLVGTFTLAFYEASSATRHALSDFEMRVFLKDSVSRAEGKMVQKRLAALPGVDRVDYLTREEVWATQSKAAAIDVTGIPNTMPDTLNVRLSDPQRSTEIESTVRGWNNDVDGVETMNQEMHGLLNLSTVARTTAIVVGLGLLLAALAVVANTIRVSVYSRQREIKIMQIVGASAAFIRLPLLFEGMIHGAVGSSLAALILWGMGRYIGAKIMGSLPQFAPYSAPVDFVALSVYLLCAGVALGGSGSVFAIRRYLRG